VLEALRRRASRFGLDVICVNVWEGTGAPREAARYCRMWGIEGTVLLDETAAYARQLGVRGVPTNVFVDETGIVRHVGATRPEELLDQAERLAPELSNTNDAGHDAPGFAAYVAGEEDADRSASDSWKD
jgi:hypothetical protein